MSTAQTFYGIDFLFMGAVWLSPFWLPIAFAWRASASKKKKLLYIVFSIIASYGIRYLLGFVMLLAIHSIGGGEEIDKQLQLWGAWSLSQSSAWAHGQGLVAEWLLKYWYLSLLSLWQVLSGLAGSYLLYKFWLQRAPQAR